MARTKTCYCGHPWSVHDEEGCKPLGWKEYSGSYCGCQSQPPESKPKKAKKVYSGGKTTMVFNIEVNVPFHSYNNQKLQLRAVTQVKRWVSSVLKHDLSYIPLYAERDESGAVIEDSTQLIKTKILKVKHKETR